MGLVIRKGQLYHVWYKHTVIEAKRKKNRKTKDCVWSGSSLAELQHHWFYLWFLLSFKHTGISSNPLNCLHHWNHYSALTHANSTSCLFCQVSREEFLWEFFKLLNEENFNWCELAMLKDSTHLTDFREILKLISSQLRKNNKLATPQCYEFNEACESTKSP